MRSSHLSKYIFFFLLHLFFRFCCFCCCCCRSEQNGLMDEIEEFLGESTGEKKQDESHWDGVISNYRTRQEEGTFSFFIFFFLIFFFFPFFRCLRRWYKLFDPKTLFRPLHVIELMKNGKIDAHVDSIEVGLYLLLLLLL